MCRSRVSLSLIVIFAMWKAGRWSYLLPGVENAKEVENHNTSSADVSEIVQEEEVDHMEKAAVKSDSESEDDKPIVEQILRNQKNGTSRGINRRSTYGKKAGVRCAERGESSILLWQHEFYYVLEREEVMGRKQAPPKPYLYQAIEFRKGIELPLEEKEGLSRKQLGEMWVQGVAYAPALNVRMHSSREKGYLFHTKFNEADARSGLFWRCPEVVRVDNSSRSHWFPCQVGRQKRCYCSIRAPNCNLKKRVSLLLPNAAFKTARTKMLKDIVDKVRIQPCPCLTLTLTLTLNPKP